MPYAIPSPTPSPSKDHRKGWLTPPTHIEDMEAGPSHATGPMPGIPRRSSSHQSHSNQSTPRHYNHSPVMSRQSSATSTAFPASKPMEGLPRRTNSGQSAFGVTGLPNPGAEGSLGLKLLPSPTKPQQTARGLKDSISSVSTVNSSLPTTPDDQTSDLPVAMMEEKGTKEDGSTKSSVPFPSFEPPVFRPVHTPHRALSQNPATTRPSLINARRNSATGHQRGNGPTGSLQIPFPTSASTSHIPGAPPSPSQHLRPTAGMIRKKSGEVVKPSLKIRSMSTPDLTRQKEGASPNTPELEANRDFPDERSKSVRFADGDDGDAQALEKVVLFLREQRPTAVGKAADPDHTGLITDTETEADDTDASDFVQFRTRRNAAARAADEQGQIELEGGSRVPRLRTDFSPDARGSLHGEYVLLERVELVNGPGPLCLRGTVIVRNVAFQKWVSIRFTLDHWQTRSEISATHVCHIPATTTGDEGWDRFSFTVKLEDFKRKIEDRQLVMCLRFSIDGQEWWDSNNGMNYNFTFKKGPPRRPNRISGPAALGGSFMRINDPNSAPITGLRQRNASTSPTREIRKAFGISSSSSTTGPRDWIFPKVGTQHRADAPSRSDSPVPSGPPPAAFKVPAPPDVHTHLTLSKYCAPSPPQSPPKEKESLTIDQALTGIPDAQATGEVKPGQSSLLAPTSAEQDRRSSWNGKKAGSWDSFARAMETFEDGPKTSQLPHDGDSTPNANGSQSPSVKAESSESSPDRSSRMMTSKRSTGDLRAMLDDDNTGASSPSASTISSPSSPSVSTLPQPPMSPSLSITSTGESSPVNTVSTNDSIADFANLAIEIDPEQRGRTMRPEYKMLNNDSYQDFLNKFCFFTSPRATPSDEPMYTRPSYANMSGSASPIGFPFFASGNNSASSPRSTPTPTKTYESSQDAFGFSPSPSTGNKDGSGTPRASPLLHGSHWTSSQLGNSSPSLAAQ